MAIKKGDRIKVHYTGRLSDGTVFDSSRGRDPLTFTLGEGSLIPGFEKAVEGRKAGERITVKIPPHEAYGASDPELIFKIPRADIPQNIPLQKGVPLQLASDQGILDVIVADVSPQEATLDANHPLAGKELEFEIEILSDREEF